MLPGAAIDGDVEYVGRRLEQGQLTAGAGSAGAIEAESAMLRQIDAAQRAVDADDLIEVVLIESALGVAHDDDRFRRGLAQDPALDRLCALRGARQRRALSRGTDETSIVACGGLHLII